MKIFAYLLAWAWGRVDKAVVDAWLWLQDRQLKRAAKRELRRALRGKVWRGR